MMLIRRIISQNSSCIGWVSIDTILMALLICFINASKRFPPPQIGLTSQNAAYHMLLQHARQVEFPCICPKVFQRTGVSCATEIIVSDIHAVTISKGLIHTESHALTGYHGTMNHNNFTIQVVLLNMRLPSQLSAVRLLTVTDGFTLPGRRTCQTGVKRIGCAHIDTRQIVKRYVFAWRMHLVLAKGHISPLLPLYKVQDHMRF